MKIDYKSQPTHNTQQNYTTINNMTK